ncbi:MAG: type II secretion system protein [bacterium]|nr:type II secretion system protein [bacterium]
MIKKRDAFTLIELIVVVSIIGILVSLIIYGLNKSRQKGRITRAKSDMLSLGYAINAYNSVHSDDRDMNSVWPRSTVTGALNTVPWELTDGGFWSKSETISTGLAYERFPCSPNYGEYFRSDTQEASPPDPWTADYQQVDFNDALATNGSNRKNACAASYDTVYVGVNWAGLDNDLGLASGSTAYVDNGFLVLYAQKPIPDGLALPSDKVVSASDYKYMGSFLLKIGGSDENCPPTGCTF